jgi:hypothetical protein
VIKGFVPLLDLTVKHAFQLAGSEASCRKPMSVADSGTSASSDIVRKLSVKNKLHDINLRLVLLDHINGKMPGWLKTG